MVEKSFLKKVEKQKVFPKVRIFLLHMVGFEPGTS